RRQRRAITPSKSAYPWMESRSDARPAAARGMRNIGAIILAAGGSSRFGQAKQLLSFEGESLVRRTVHAAIEAGCASVIVVVGDARDRIETELRETPAVIVENPEWQQGLGTSIRCGLRSRLSSEPEAEDIVLLACDQPLVD